MSIERWIKKEQERMARTPTLEAALMLQSFAQYIMYRLRFFALRVSAGVLIHAAEFPIIYHSINPGNLSPVILYAAATHLVLQMWWGALETMRTAVREAVENQSTYRIERVIHPWLKRSFSLGAVFFLLGIALSMYLCFRARAPIVSPEHAIMLVFLLRSTVNFPLTAYHSGIYAVRRVGRPVLVVFIVDAVGLLSAFLLHPIFGAWVGPVCILTTSVIQSGISLIYIRKMYEFSGWNVSVFPRFGKTLPLRDLYSARCSIPALAALTMALDSLVIIAISTSEYAARNISLAILIFLSAPLIRACHDWAMLFLPDIRRLDLDLFQRFFTSMNSAISKAALVVALACWLVAAAVSALVGGMGTVDLILPLLPFFIARSILSLSQVRAFTLHKFLNVVTGGVVFAIGGIFISEFQPDPAKQLVHFALLYLPVLLITENRWLDLMQRRRARPLLLPSTWVQKLNAASAPRAIGMVQFTSVHESSATERKFIARSIAKLLSDAGAATMIRDSHLLIFDDRLELREEVLRVIAQTGGNIERIQWFETTKDCIAAIRNILSPHEISSMSNFSTSSTGPGDTLAALFNAQFPTGWMVRVGEHSKLAAKRESSELSAAMRGALYFAKSWGSFRNEREFHITSLTQNDAMSDIFVIPMGEGLDRRLMRDWENLVALMNLESCQRVTSK